MYRTPSISWRGKLAKLVAQVHTHKPEEGERAGTMKCICGATLHFTIASTGRSSGQCSAGCPARWAH